jgi:hypothetical protein
VKISDFFSKKVYNPVTNRQVTVGYALNLDPAHPAYKAAAALIGKVIRQKKDDAKAGDVRTKANEPESQSVPSDIGTDPVARRAVKQLMSGSQQSQAELDEHGQKHLNGVSPVAIATDYMSLLSSVDDSKVTSFNLHVKPEVNELFFSIETNDGSKITRTIRTDPGTGENVLFHNLFELGPKISRGSALGKRMLRETLRLADKINAVRADVSAGLSIGGYIWAKYGAILHAEERIYMYPKLYAKLEALGHPAAAEKVRRKMDYDIEELQKSIKFYENLLSKTPDNPTSIENELKRERRNLAETIKEKNKILTFLANNQDQLTALIEYAKKQSNIAKDIQNSDSDDVAEERAENELDPHFLALIAQTPVGKLLLAGTNWSGYFDLRKNSRGRQMLEDAIAE